MQGLDSIRNIGALNDEKRVGLGFRVWGLGFGARYTIIIIRNPPKNSNYW